MSDSVKPHRWQPPSLHRPWDSPGKNTGVGWHFLLQCRKVKVKSLSHVRLFTTPWTAAYQAPPSMRFSRQEYWSGVPLPSLHRTTPTSSTLVFRKMSYQLWDRGTAWGPPGPFVSFVTSVSVRRAQSIWVQFSLEASAEEVRVLVCKPPFNTPESDQCIPLPWVRNWRSHQKKKKKKWTICNSPK